MRIPSSTYRVQLGPTFTLREAADLASYLSLLGITDLYTSPITQARRGSDHGYDVVDPTEISFELGGDAGAAELAGQLSAQKMGWLLDIVPNHACLASARNWRWQDVLEQGTASDYARFFDIYWESGRFVLPILGEPRDTVVARGELSVAVRADRWVVAYYEHELPINPRTLPAGARSLLDGRRLAPGTDRALAERMARELSEPERLSRLLDAQAYELADWRSAASRPGYRRFFDVNELVGVRVEDSEVFRQSHEKILKLALARTVTGLRIDHIDGLREPRSYLRRLQNELCSDAYVLVEKIVEPGERLPRDWPVSGTTGYELISAVTRLLVYDDGEREVERIYRTFVGEQRPFAQIEHQARRDVLAESLRGDAERLATMARSLLDEPPPGSAVDEALIEILSCLRVYRTYFEPPDPDLSEGDAKTLRAALETAAENRPDLAAGIASWTRLLIDGAGNSSDGNQDLRLRFQQLSGPVAAKGLEDTALYRFFPLAAKNEVGCRPDDPPLDTAAFHRFNAQRAATTPHALSATSTHDTKRGEDVRARLAALSELAAEWGTVLEQWHRMNRPLKAHLAGEEAPDRNDEYLFYQTLLGILPHGSRSVRWDALSDRLDAYMQKALREAKRHTSWYNPRSDYESATRDFVRTALDPERSAAFLNGARAFGKRLSRLGVPNALCQLVLKLGSPGVPDFYQGTELWGSSLVDPDNRRPVDFERRRALLGELDRGLGAEELGRLLADDPEGKLKLFVTRRGLALRRAYPVLFAEGDYLPLEVRGPRARHVIAFARRHGSQVVLVAAARWFGSLGADEAAPVGPEVWRRTEIDVQRLSPAEYTDTLTGSCTEAERHDGATCLAAEAIFRHLPVALMHCEPRNEF